MDQGENGKSLDARLREIEDRLEIYNLVASHPPSADTGADYYTRAVYTEDGIFDRGEGLDGAEGIRMKPSIRSRCSARYPSARTARISASS